MDTHTFIMDLKRHVGRKKKVKSSSITRETGLSQGHLSNILSEKVVPTLNTVIKLWPYAYGLPFPQLPQDLGVEGEAGAQGREHKQASLAANG